MIYIENPFLVGQKIVCVNDHWPMKIFTGSDKSRIGTIPHIHPALWEVYVVDEILGEFLRFNQFDEYDESHPEYGWRWWKHTHFAPIQKEEILKSVYQESVVNS